MTTHEICMGPLQSVITDVFMSMCLLPTCPCVCCQHCHVHVFVANTAMSMCLLPTLPCPCVCCQHCCVHVFVANTAVSVCLLPTLCPCMCCKHVHVHEYATNFAVSQSMCWLPTLLCPCVCCKHVHVLVLTATDRALCVPSVCTVVEEVAALLGCSYETLAHGLMHRTVAVKGDMVTTDLSVSEVGCLISAVER